MVKFEDVKQFCKNHGIAIRQFPEKTPTAQTAATAVGCTVAEIAKTILLKIGDSHVVVIASGAVKISSSKIKQATGLKGKVIFPQPEEVQDLTGYEPGGVSPFLLPSNLPVFLDQTLQKYPVIFPAGGNDSSAAVLSPALLAEITTGQWAEVAQTA